MTVDIKFGGYQGENSVHTRGGRVLAEAVARETDGRARVVFEENITLNGRKAADLLSMTERGDLDGCYFSSSYIAGRVPELGLFDLHFIVPNRHAAYAVLDGDLGDLLRDKVAAATGFRVLNYWDNGLRHISARTPIRSPADCRGIAIRTLANDDHQRVFRSLGFEPMAIDVRDLPEACRSGRVMAQENPLTNIYNFRIHETHRAITLTQHLLGVALCLFNAETVASWSDEVRAGVQRAVDQATTAQRDFAAAEDAICMAALEEEGVELIALSDAMRAQFAEAARPEVEKTRTRFDPALIALFEKALKAA